MKRTIKLTESYLHNIINESVKNVLKENESSFDDNGYFNSESHNDELQEKFINKLESLSKMINDNIRDFDYIAQVTTDDEINRRARVIVSALLSAGRDMRKVMQLTSSDRWDVSE